MTIAPTKVNSTSLASAYRIGPAPKPAAPPEAARLPVTRVGTPASDDREQPSGAAGAFRLYTRAADVNEVATAVTLGRSLDVQG